MKVRSGCEVPQTGFAGGHTHLFVVGGIVGMLSGFFDKGSVAVSLGDWEVVGGWVGIS